MKQKYRLIDPKIDWDKAEHAWIRYYDDGIVTLDPDLFFGVKKKQKGKE